MPFVFPIRPLSACRAGVDFSLSADRNRNAIDAMSTAQHIRALLGQPQHMPRSVLESAQQILVACGRGAARRSSECSGTMLHSEYRCVSQPYGKIWLVGAGPGDPELLTLKAVKAIANANVLLVDDLVSEDV